LQYTQLNEATAFHAGNPLWRGANLMGANAANGDWVKMGWVMGTTRSAPYWGTADNVSIAQGNHELWIKGRSAESAANGRFGMAFRFLRLAP
jgi:hypothetical protein